MLEGMARIALFHSVLGVRAGVRDAAHRLQAAGHEVTIVDQYGGRVFDDYDEADAFASGIGFPDLMRSALDAVAGWPDGFLVAGFSNGGGMAEFVATQRAVAGAVLLAGVVPVEEIGPYAPPGTVPPAGLRWLRGAPVQIHYSQGDPYRNQDWIDSFAASVRAAGGVVESFDYPGEGHLFTDPSLPAEFDAASTDLLWQRVLAFCAAPPAG
jgi:dienelactone hydrolase